LRKYVESFPLISTAINVEPSWRRELLNALLGPVAFDDLVEAGQSAVAEMRGLRTKSA